METTSTEKFVEPKSGKYFDNTTPITNEVIQVFRSNEKTLILL